VKKTGRVIVAHEAPLTGGFAAEVAAVIQVSCSPQAEKIVQLCFVFISHHVSSLVSPPFCFCVIMCEHK
jgi:pyruvate/2-oxoglutarate/acetoin dehydrogenase E1 component